MARTPIASAFVARDFAVITYQGCDGYPAARSFDVVVATLADGREAYLPNGRRVRDEEGYQGAAATYHDADRLCAKVQAMGSIDLEHWALVEPLPSLEERFSQYAEEEALERGGYR